MQQRALSYQLDEAGPVEMWCARGEDAGSQFDDDATKLQGHGV
jgi:hypothetical protein